MAGMSQMPNLPGGGSPPPPSGQGQQNPLQALAGVGGNRGAGGGSLLQVILAFLAGAGFDKVMANVQKLMGSAGKGSKGGDPNRPHQMSPNQPQPPNIPGQPNQAQIPPQVLQALLAQLAQKGRTTTPTP